MREKFDCRKCGNDLERWNNGMFLWINHCPSCGAKLLKKQCEALHRKTTCGEISDMIQDRLLSMLEVKSGDDISTDELAQAAWERENVDGVVFYNNYTADKFAIRHEQWVDHALEYICDNCGDVGHYTEMRINRTDRFLVLAFIYATERYLHDQLEINRDEGNLSKKRIREITRQVKQTEYEGGF
jgi:DNA-directed RNA polymerase subunit RPC12/RpoP